MQPPTTEEYSACDKPLGRGGSASKTILDLFSMAFRANCLEFRLNLCTAETISFLP